jgi:hypothetical protein
VFQFDLSNKDDPRKREKKKRETRPTILGEGGYGEYNKRRESKKK